MERNNLPDIRGAMRDRAAIHSLTSDLDWLEIFTKECLIKNADLTRIERVLDSKNDCFIL